MFRLLAVADGHVPTHSAARVDPLAGAVTLKLQAHDLERRSPDLIVRGQVVDNEGKPVECAEVSPFARKKGNSTQFGGLSGIDALAITNARGEFRLGVAEKGIALSVQVDARNLARRKFADLDAGAEHRLELRKGVTVVGAVAKNGKPLPGIVIGLAHANRNAATFLGDQKIRTDESGQFLFRNVPANETYAVYGVMESCREHGGIKVHTVRLEPDVTSKDVGVLTVEAGHSLTGRVILSDDKPVPAGTRVSLSRDIAWDVQVADVAADGSFAFRGLPAEGYTLATRVRGYHLSTTNASYDLFNERLVGRIEKPITGLRLLLEPGAFQVPDFSRIKPDAVQELERRRHDAMAGAPNP